MLSISTALTPADVTSLADGKPVDHEIVGNWTFENNPKDSSGNRNHGIADGAVTVAGKIGKAYQFASTGGGAGKKTFVEHDWTADIPLLARAMLLTRTNETDGRNIYISGPPDIIDEEETFRKLTESDPEVRRLLAKQDRALAGKDGGILRVVSGEDGSTLHEIKTEYLPVWDGMAAASERLFVSTTDGRVICLK